MPSSAHADANAQESPLVAWIGPAIATVAPFMVALGHAGTGSTWRGDIVVLRGLGWVGWGHAGSVSALLAQAAFYLPLGPIHFRVALVAAAVLGAAGLAIYALARDLLVQQADAPRLTYALATIAALTATLSPTGQADGAVAGGSGVALLLSALVLYARPAEALASPARALVLGMLAGALVGESWLTAAALASGIAVGVAVDELALGRGWRARALRPEPPRGIPFAVGGAAASAVLFFSPVWVRPFANAPFLEIGRAVHAIQAGSAAPRPVGGALERLYADGLILVTVAAVGFVLSVLRRGLRGAVAPLVVITVFDAASVFAEGRLLGSDDIAPLHFVATAALAIGAAIAVQAVATALLAWRLPMAKGAAILLVMTDLTLAVAAAEEASFANDRSAWRGAEAFTDEALEQVPPGTALLVRSRPLAWRLWAAQLAHGSRPDVLVVPVPAAGDTRLALRLLRAEKALQKALQDLSLEGRPGEEALTILADARPVMTELDPAWDRRVLSHFVPDHLWLRFAPEPRGPSDRKAAFLDLQARAARVLAASGNGQPDVDTARAVRSRLVDGAVLAASLGDRDEASAIATRIGAIAGGELFAAELTQKLLMTKSGPVDVKALAR